MTNNNGSTPAQPPPLTAAQTKRVAKCQRAIQNALKRHKCIMLPQYVVLGTNIEASIRILPRPS